MKRPNDGKPTRGEEPPPSASREGGAEPRAKERAERHRSYSAPSIPPPRRESDASAPSVQVEPRSDPRRYTTKRLKRRRTGRPGGPGGSTLVAWVIALIVIALAILLVVRRTVP